MNAHTPCKVRVVVRDDKDPEIIVHDRTSDHNDKYFLEWIARTSYWALRNRKTVHMFPVVD